MLLPPGVSSVRRVLSLLLSVGLAFQIVLLSAQPAAAQGDSVSVTKPDSGTTNCTFMVSLSVPQNQPVTVDFSTSDGTALAGQDYVATSGTLIFQPGETSKIVEVPVIGNTIPEGNKNFFLITPGSRASCTIVDNHPGISIAGTSIEEGNAGTHNATFVVTLSVPTTLPLSVDFTTSDGTATVEHHDYVRTSGTLTFAPGGTSKIIRVPVIGNTIPEPDKTFFVNLFNPSRGEITTAQATGIILNDDPVAFTGEPPAASTVPGGPVPPGARPSISASGVRGVTSSGQVLTFGDAGFFGSVGGSKLNQAVVGTAVTPSRNGYWLAASDGGIFAFGDAKFFGSTGGIKLNKAIVAIAATPTGNGYWLVASDGGIFAFTAQFFGSGAGSTLNQPIVGIAATPTGQGYWLIERDGGLFAFGDAPSFAPKTDIPPGGPVVGMAS